jgi:glutaredoxin
MSITIYSKRGCIYCDKAKDLLTTLNVPFIMDTLVPDDTEYQQKRDALFDKYNHRSFPLILIGDVFLGGFTELQNAYSTLRLHELAARIGIDIPMDF